MKNVFEYTHYLDFLIDQEKFFSEKKVGFRSHFAKKVRCQPAYISRVMSGRVDLSLEQSFAAARFFRLSESETDFFLQLVQFARAGSPDHKNYLRKELNKKRELQLDLKSRLKKKEIDTEQIKKTYYSSWKYAAAHIAYTLPNVSSIEQAAEKLNISPDEMEKVTHFLLESRLLSKKGDTIFSENADIFIERDSPLIIQHHSNWKIHALKKFQEAQSTEKDFHFSSVVSLSKEDADQLREKLKKTVEDFAETVKNTKEEVVYVYQSDFYHL